jgi:Ca-activated chloride channel family protein
LFASYCSWSQTTKKENLEITRILFVFDGSQSMYARWESGRKIEVAQRLLTRMLDSLQSLRSESFQIALRVYGHQKPVPPQDCNDTRLEVPFGYNNFGRIKKVIRRIKPKGTTPIARSLLRSATDFTACENCRNIIILITDGVESCDEDPCAASRHLQKNGITLKPFVIGVGLDLEFKQSFECVGTYFDAANEKTFKEVLGVVISQALNNTSAQINLLDINQNPSETDVPITFYNRVSKKVNKQFIHTLNNYGNPDTIYMDPLVNYDIVVHSLPEVRIDSIKIAPGAHNTVGIDLPRGDLELKVRAQGRTAYKKLHAIIRQDGENKILHVQDFNTTQKYLRGPYDLEILSLPRYRQKIQIEAGKTTTINIPPPGVVNFTSTANGYGSILKKEKNEWKWIIDLSSAQSRQSFNMQPGNYKVVFRSKTSKDTEYSVTKNFTINSGTTTIVKLN